MVTKEEVIYDQIEGKVSAPSVSKHDKSSENNEDLKAVSVGAHTVYLYMTGVRLWNALEHGWTMGFKFLRV